MEVMQHAPKSHLIDFREYKLYKEYWGNKN